MKQEEHKDISTISSQPNDFVKEKKVHWHPEEFTEQQPIHIDRCGLSPELINDQEKINNKIDSINTKINECLKLQQQSWKFSTFEANQFLKNTDNMIQKYVCFLQKVQDFYDNHPEIAKLLNENVNLRKDQDYFGDLLNKYQQQADLWYDKLKYNLTYRNELQNSLKQKKKKASQLLISRINLERILNSKKYLFNNQRQEKCVHLRRGRSNHSQNENETSVSILHRSLSSKKQNLNLSSIITSTNASQNKLSVNDSLVGGSIFPSITPQAVQKSNSKQPNSAQKLQNDKTFLTLSQNGKINSENNLNKYLNVQLDKKCLQANEGLQQNQTTSTQKDIFKTEMDVLSPFVKNAKKQLETLENVFKVQKSKGEYSLSSYNNLSYLRDKRKEMKQRLIQNKSQINQYLAALSNKSKIDELNQSDIIQQNKSSRYFIKQTTNNQNSIQKYNKGSTSSMNTYQNMQENPLRINDNSVCFIDQSDIKSTIVLNDNEDINLHYYQEINLINGQIKQEKNEIKQKYKQYLEKSRQFYRIEYFFQECLECSEKNMMKKIENLQLNGFELNNEMENLLDILDKYDDQGGVKNILSKQGQNILNQLDSKEQQQQQQQIENQKNMNYQQFNNLTTKQLLFSICRSSQMKTFLTKYLNFKKIQTNSLVNEIKKLMHQYQDLKQTNKIKQNQQIFLQQNNCSLQKIQSTKFIDEQQIF
ncbi:hypothetical protein ABPG72_011779 [Tetrahymena utriculariae]